MRLISPVYCQIRIKGHLSNPWSDWLGGLAIENQPHGEAVLSGTLADQAALYGVLDRLRDLGVELLSLNCRTESAAAPNRCRTESEDNCVGHQSQAQCTE